MLFSFSEHPAQEKACSGLWAITTVLLLRSAQTWNSLIRVLSLQGSGQASSGHEIVKSVFMIRNVIEKCTCNWLTASQHLYFLAEGKGGTFSQWFSAFSIMKVLGAGSSANGQQCGSGGSDAAVIMICVHPEAASG